MKKISATEWLAKEIQEQLNMFFPNATLYQPTIEQAKQMEKEQIENAYWDGGQDIPLSEQRCKQYYNETFKSE